MPDARPVEHPRPAAAESPLAELARRHVDWVYSAARRQVGDAMAEDVTQAVFLVLVQKAKHLPAEAKLAPWLFRVLRYAAARALRSEQRRKKHERQASLMAPSSQDSRTEDQWQQMLPLLDELVAHLSATDQQAILLRFYQRLSFAEVGRASGLTEDAAKKRVSRAVEKLRGMFHAKGLSLAGGALAAGLLANTTQAAPAAVLQLVVASIAAPTAVAESVTLIAKGAMQMMTWAKLKLATVAATVLALMAGAGVVISQVLSAPPSPATAHAAANPSTRNDAGPDVSRSPATLPGASNFCKITQLRVYPGQGDAAAVIVTDERGRSFSIVLGSREGELLAPWVEDRGSPDSNDIYAALLRALKINDSGVTQLTLASLQNHTFLATLQVRSPEQVEQVDCRPSDGMNIAARTRAAMFVDDAMAAGLAERRPDGTPLTPEEVEQQQRRTVTINGPATRRTSAPEPIELRELDAAGKKDVETLTNLKFLVAIERVTVKPRTVDDPFALQLHQAGGSAAVTWSLSHPQVNPVAQAWSPPWLGTVQVTTRAGALPTTAATTMPTIIRPWAAKTFCNILQAAGIQLDAVVLFNAKDGARSAHVVLSVGPRRSIVQLDAFDALCIALSARAPLLIVPDLKRD